MIEITRSFEIRSVQIDDVEQVASVHAQIFPDYFLTRLGKPFLNRFYKHIVTYPCTALAAFVQGECVGIVAGAPQSESFYNEFYRKNFFPLVLITLKRLALDPIVRKEIYLRIGRIRAALKAVTKKYNKSTVQVSQKALKKNSPQQGVAEDLLSIGVLSDYQGQGIAEELVRQFCKALALRGVTSVMLTVQRKNSRAIHFYEKTGWQFAGSDNLRVHFLRSTEYS